MKNSQSNKPNTQTGLPSVTLYQIDSRNMVLLSDLLVYLKKDTKWFNNNFPNPQSNISAKHFFQLEEDYQWVLNGRENSAASNTFVVTETGALLVSSRLEADEVLRAFEAIKIIFSQSPKSKISYANLTPLQNHIKDAALKENTEYYHEVLDNALKEKSIRNIAIAAPYGGGKTTIINSYFDRRANYVDKVIFISLATFDVIEDEDAKSIKDYERQKIEKNILQQLLYQTAANQLPESRILRIHNISTSIRNFGLFKLTIFFFALAGIYIDKIFPTIYESEYTNVAIVFKLLGLAALALIIPPVLFDVFKSVKNIKINKFSTLAGDIELSSNRELSVFNQFIDEL